jgi:predicted O-linked N-acetylglucosamine transferase (SPINDLY family)
VTDAPDPIEATLQQALARYQSGHLAEAEALVRDVLARDPDRPAAHHFLGVVALTDGRIDLAIASIGRAIELRPAEAQCHSNLGNALLAAGRLAEAEASYREALRLAPDAPQMHYNLGALLAQVGRLSDAEASFRAALAMQPEFPDAQFNLANTLRAAGHREDAAAAYRAALALQPQSADAHYNLGNVLVELGRPAEAEASYREALRLAPQAAAVHSNLGTALIGLGRFEEAAAACTQALQLQPGFAEAHANLANALFGLERYAAAETSCQAALRQKPDLVAALHTLANTLLAQGRVDEAAAWYERVLALEPGHADARIGLCVAQLGAAWRNDAEILRRRAAYEDQLRQLADDVERGAVPDLASGIGSAQPFFLPYQGLDDRALQSLCGTLICKVMGERYPPLPLPPQPGPGEKIRVGIVSGFFRRHSNWKIPIKGWLTQLDRRRFHVICYHTGTVQDAETKIAAGLCDRFVQGPLTVAAWRNEIAADAPHVLIYPEIGIDPIAVQLAAQRLARVQCNSWGQPVTSGMPTLDYYLSSGLMEPPDAQALYTERLIALPHLSIYYEPPAGEALPAIDRAELGLRPGSMAYWSGQTLSKYLPRYDDLFPRIAREVPDCQFVFLEFAKGRHVTELFRERLARAFQAHGLDAARHCVFLPRLSEPRFRAALGRCDAILDSVGWSGCNSTLESLAHDLPIVTLPTEFMRGRHTLAILRQMGVEDTIAATQEEYVALAVRLARDPDWRAAVSTTIRANKSRVYRDSTCIAALEEFLVAAVRTAR